MQPPIATRLWQAFSWWTFPLPTGFLNLISFLPNAMRRLDPHDPLHLPPLPSAAELHQPTPVANSLPGRDRLNLSEGTLSQNEARKRRATLRHRDGSTGLLAGF